MKVAVIGSGVSGLGATWLLNEYSNHEVHLFEADGRPGGHANTVSFAPPGRKGGPSVDVDTGFIVLNPTTYPNFLRFLRLSKVPILKTEMTFSVSRDNGAFEWAGKNLFTVFCQPRNLLDLGMWRLVWDVLRFNACARRLIITMEREGKQQQSERELSIGEYLRTEGYSNAFIDNYLIPMTAAIWSTPPDTCITDFPAQTLLRFMNNHHLLQLTGKPSWLTIQGGSRLYVNKILEALPASQLHLSAPVKSVLTRPGSPTQLTTASGETFDFDHVIIATHSDTALDILGEGNITQEEQSVLSGFGWSKNVAVLHADANLMPKRRAAWSCWNYLTASDVSHDGKTKANVNQVALTYCMNDLQHISEDKYGPVLVTLNPPFEPRADTVVGTYKYDHPVFSAKAIRSQRLMSSIQNARGITFAGAYLGYGFHEDGFTAGLKVATDYLGARPPFDLQIPNRDPGSLWVSTMFEVLESARRVASFALFPFLVLLEFLFSPTSAPSKRATS